jgi:hypothetical protein
MCAVLLSLTLLVLFLHKMHCDAREIKIANFLGDSIRLVDLTGNDRIRYQIVPKSVGIPIKTNRNPTIFQQIPT